jgi:hypothetical protein
MAERNLLYIDSTSGTWAEAEAADTTRLGGLGIGTAPGSDGIALASGDLTITGSGAISMSGTTGGITSAASISLQSGGDITVSGGGTLTGLPSTPTGSTDAASKAYVDSAISGNTWRDPVITMEMISDALSAPPGSPTNGDSYVVGGQSGGPFNITAVNTSTETFTVTGDHSSLATGDVILVAGSTGNDGYWTVASTSGTGPTDITVSEDVTDATGDGTADYADPGTAWDTIGPDKIVTYDGTNWDVVRASNNDGLQSGDRVVLKESGTAGSFSGQTSDIAVYNGSTWDFTTPANGWSVLVQDYDHGGYWDNSAWVYELSNDDWVQFSGTGQIIAGDGLTKDGNTLDVGAGNAISVGNDTVAVNVTGGTDGTSLDLASGDEFLFADASDAGATKKTTIDKIQDYVSAAGLDNDLTDGNGIVDFTYNGSAAATVTVEAVSADRITVGASGIDVAGLPAQFKINGSAVSANVTQTNVDTLVDGWSAPASVNDASALHIHNQIAEAINADAAGVTANYAVRISGTDVILNGDPTTQAGSEIIGVSLDTASSGNPARVVLNGIARGVLGGTGTAGAQYFMGAAGVLSTSIPTTGSNYVIQMGFGLNTNDLALQIVSMGRRRAP